MAIYDETTRQEIASPDLSAGYLYDGVIVTGRTEPYMEVLEGTVTAQRPEGLRRLVPAQAIVEPCQWYHSYTEEERKQQEETASLEERLAALEEELSAAKILLGVE